MDEPIEERYFNWLCAKVLTPTIPVYWDLMRILFRTEFHFVVNRDRNRAEEGRELREDFFREAYLKPDPHWMSLPVSILEVLIAMARRAHFETNQPVKDWFWEMLTNLGLDEFRQVSKSDEDVIEDILYRFIWRQYEPSGHGGIFPLRWPRRDQREIEIWYQFCDYLEEQSVV